MAIDPDTGEALAAYKIIGPFRGRAIAFARAPSWRGPSRPRVAGDSVAGPGSCRPPSSSPGCDRSWTLGVPTSFAGAAPADGEAARSGAARPAAPEPRRKTSFEERHDW
ncbi:hypothetical protein JL720_16616 [Aureococcus anophagefferens]|nr:hypothetical protein JL720_16616 [Aureococcus anophagefferens]